MSASGSRQFYRAWGLTVAENDPLELALLRGAGKNRLLDRVGGSKTENEHRLRLANAMCAIHRLQIAGGHLISQCFSLTRKTLGLVLLWVPVRIKDDDGISTDQVQADTSGSSRKQEDVGRCGQAEIVNDKRSSWLSTAAYYLQRMARC